MRSRTDLVLKAAKEVAVKYIESGRLSLTNFGEAFASIYEAIDRVVPHDSGVFSADSNRKDDDRAAKVEYYTRGYKGPELKVTRLVKSADVEEWVAAGTGEKTVVTVTGREKGVPAAERFKPDSLKSNPSLVQLMKERAKLLEEESKLAREIAELRAGIEKLKK